MNTEMFWSASGAMTDLAILVTPMGWELEKPPPPDTTLRASQVASATLRCSEEGSSGGGTEGGPVTVGPRSPGQSRPEVGTTTWDQLCGLGQPHPLGPSALISQRRMGSASEGLLREGRARKALRGFWMCQAAR